MRAALLPARPGTLAVGVLDQLRQAIQEGRYAPGQRLIESDLMAELATGRGPIREALRRLGSEGIVELVPNRGAMVRRYSLKELADLFRIREALEGLAARMAAERVAALKARRQFQDQLRAVQAAGIEDRVLQFSEENRHFHQLLVDFADNAQLGATLRRMQLPIMRLQVRAALNEEYRAQSRREHRAVAKAVLQGEPDAAELAMRAHLRNAGARTLLLVQATERRRAA